MAVNLSAKQFHAGNLVQNVMAMLHHHDLDPKYLTLELTESLMMEIPHQTVEVLNQLMALGPKISMNDLGRDILH